MIDKETALREIARYRLVLTRQEVRMLRGQVLSGNAEAAMRGLARILGRPV